MARRAGLGAALLLAVVIGGGYLLGKRAAAGRGGGERIGKAKEGKRAPRARGRGSSKKYLKMILSCFLVLFRDGKCLSSFCFRREGDVRATCVACVFFVEKTLEFVASTNSHPSECKRGDRELFVVVARSVAASPRAFSESVRLFLRRRFSVDRVFDVDGLDEVYALEVSGG